MNLINWLGEGTITSTKNTDTGEVMVHLPIMAPQADGRNVTNVEQKQESSLNAAGEMETSTTMVSNVVPAEWRSMGEPNRKTPPDVREGSKVSVYQVSGQNKLYWTTFGFGAETHRLETIIWGYSANPNIAADAPFSVDDYYTATIDTRTGFFALRTSQANGENQGLEVRVDGGNGRVDMSGTNGSTFCWDDHNSQLTYNNKEGTIIGADKKQLLLSCEDSLTVNATESINVITKVLNVQCQDVNIKAQKAKVAIPETEWQGNIKQTGNYNQEGNYDQKGTYTHQGNTQQTGNTTSTGTVTGMTEVKTATVRLNIHGHTGVENGDGISGPPMPTG